MNVLWRKTGSEGRLRSKSAATSECPSEIELLTSWRSGNLVCCNCCCINPRLTSYLLVAWNVRLQKNAMFPQSEGTEKCIGEFSQTFAVKLSSAWLELSGVFVGFWYCISKGSIVHPIYLLHVRASRYCCDYCVTRSEVLAMRKV